MSKSLKIKLKGGSLSETFLIQDPLLYNGTQFVRKTVSLTQNREYGFQRWYSQLKRLQRYSILVPGLFPEVLKYGMDGEQAYFDMNFIEGSVNVQEYLCNESSKSKIEIFFDHLKVSMSRLHDIKIRSCPEAIEIYVYEEVIQKIKDCFSSDRFMKFLQFRSIVFNGAEVNSFMYEIENFKKLLNDNYLELEETYSHGNLTLENILYIPDQERIVFIDPYEENIIDSKLADYSQLLQSSNAKYEILNKLTPCISKNEVSLFISQNFGLDHFNCLLIDYLKTKLSREQYIAVKLLEISQFIRMLPFKKEVDEDKMILFYALASKLFDDLTCGI